MGELNRIIFDGDVPFVDDGKGEKVFEIPVQWMVSDIVKIRANSLEEAIKMFIEHEQQIPIGLAPEYVDDSYKMSVDAEVTLGNVENIAQELEENYGDFLEEYYMEDGVELD